MAWPGCDRRLTDRVSETPDKLSVGYPASGSHTVKVAPRPGALSA